VCGYSLGFYAAAVFAHSITVQTALGWLSRVNAFNARDFPEGNFGVAVSTGLSKDELEDAFMGWGLDGLFVSNVNNSRQIVFTGPKRVVADAAERLEAVALSVQEAPLDIPLHTPYMDRARREVDGWWSTIPAATPSYELISPVDGALVRSGRALKREMLTSLASPTDWVAVVKTLDELDLDWVLDLSPGGELGRMARWTKRNMDIRPASLLWEGRE
jgi:malonyl CoA-acyl carrier protein transacylase